MQPTAKFSPIVCSLVAAALSRILNEPTAKRFREEIKEAGRAFADPTVGQVITIEIVED